jgi:two-component system sensor histidine kinase VanS
LKNNHFRREFMKKTLLQCGRTVILATLMYAAVLAAGYVIVHSIIWQPTRLYWFLQSLKNYMTLLLPLIWLVMSLAIIYFYWQKSVGYIEDIVEASKTLIQPDEEDIRLPAELREIEDSMNQIKRTSLKNEREAREAEQRKNDLVVNLAHDIRTPLSSVIGYLSLLDEAPDMPPEQRAKYVGITLEKAYRLEQLIDEFFEITRFNLSSIVLNRGKINLPFMLRQQADEFYPLLAPQGKQAVVEAPDSLVLWGDADKLSRVFNNILKNAIAYSYNGTTITVTAFAHNAQVVIQFANQGDPIPAQKLDTIFERFFRLDAARSSYTGGSGLGLAIAKEIVVAHGGTISAQSEGKETVFTVMLPNVEEEAGQKEQPS